MAQHYPLKNFDKIELLQKAVECIIHPSHDNSLDEQVGILLNLTLAENFEKHYLSLPATQSKLRYYQEKLASKGCELRVLNNISTDLPIIKGISRGVAYEIDMLAFSLSINQCSQSLILLAKKSLQIELVDILKTNYNLPANQAKLSASAFLDFAFHSNWVGLELSFKRDLDTKCYYISDSYAVM